MRQLRDLQLDITGLGRQHPLAMTIAFIRTRLGALVSAGADRFGGFELDQLLHHQTHSVSDQIDSVAGAQRVEKFGQGRLV
jgi:hypothetical protein